MAVRGSIINTGSPALYIKRKTRRILTKLKNFSFTVIKTCCTNIYNILRKSSRKLVDIISNSYKLVAKNINISWNLLKASYQTIKNPWDMILGEPLQVKICKLLVVTIPLLVAIAIESETGVWASIGITCTILFHNIYQSTRPERN